MLAASEDQGLIDSQVRPLVGQHVRLEVGPDGVTLQAAAPPASGADAPGRAAPAAAAAAPRRSAPPAARRAVGVIPTAAATVDSCGAKAAACGQLERIAAGQAGSAAAAFATPPGCVLPFGSLAAAVTAAGGAVPARYSALLQSIETADVGALETVCEELQALVAGLAAPPAALAQVGSFFPGARLMVRSSANVEDLAGMSAAGLYESLHNVPADQVAELGAAVARVWASLYSRRAVLSRRCVRRRG